MIISMTMLMIMIITMMRTITTIANYEIKKIRNIIVTTVLLIKEHTKAVTKYSFCPAMLLFTRRQPNMQEWLLRN